MRQARPSAVTVLVAVVMIVIAGLCLVDFFDAHAAGAHPAVALAAATVLPLLLAPSRHPVAALVPTTVLAEQHRRTFAARMAEFPFEIASLSRFNTAREQREIIERTAKGEIDILIGTHRMASPDVQFANLGLLIIDEEQRFGVEIKERLKALRTTVDVLTMTATPIPRTLEMAMSGIRDMSVIDTPPEDRHPVLTFVGPSNEETIARAIRREMLREGQTFYVHNTVHDIDRVAGHVQRLVPDARVGIAHGQMEERRLERVMLDFWDRRYDVLVKTTIIESGLDIPTANTLIVDRADVELQPHGDQRRAGGRVAGHFDRHVEAQAGSVLVRTELRDGLHARAGRQGRAEDRAPRAAEHPALIDECPHATGQGDCRETVLQPARIADFDPLHLPVGAQRRNEAEADRMRPRFVRLRGECRRQSHPRNQH